MAGEESRSAVLAALTANAAIAVGKLTAGAVTGSGAMFAEGGHSIADTTNQVFLLVGIKRAQTKPDDDHPHGYGKEAFFWSFLAAIFIFVAGATFSLFQGIRTVIDPGEFHERTFAELGLAFGVLGGAFVFEAISLVIAIRLLLRSARAQGWSVLRFLRESPDMTLKTVFWEDSAALLGLLLAAVGLAVAEIAKDETPDGVASILIGVLLVIVAVVVGAQARGLLLGAAASPELRDKLRRIALDFDEVETVLRLLTMQLGARSVLVTGELQIGQDLTVDQAEHLIGQIDREIARLAPEVTSTFWELRRNPIDTSVGPRIFN
ncbi:MAG: Divalent metal cation (Fe/Co/Zn/Cd) transporter [Chloroflexi bacterium]|nr:MAG: Divalent metal cation (Fe/Co/Zn/Cd) transporter [Chloroflexota bacterium]